MTRMKYWVSGRSEGGRTYRSDAGLAEVQRMEKSEARMDADALDEHALAENGARGLALLVGGKRGGRMCENENGRERLG